MRSAAEKARRAKWVRDNRSKVNAYRQTPEAKAKAREYRSRPEVRERARLQEAERRKTEPHRAKQRARKRRQNEADNWTRARAQSRRYNSCMPPAMFNTLMALQDSKCAICGSALDGGKHTHADHDHVSRTPRGLLCRWCNLAEGNVLRTGMTGTEFGKKLDAYLADPPALAAALM